MTIGWEPSPPYQWRNENGELTGLDIDVISAVLSKAGYAFEFKKLPWSRILKSAIKNGEIDIAMGATKTLEREAFVHYSDIAYAPWDSVLLVLDDNLGKFSQVKRLSDIINTPYTLGITRGHIYSNEYSELLNNPNFSEKLYTSQREDLAIKMLLSKRVDAVLASSISILHNMMHWQETQKIRSVFFLKNDKEGAGSYFIFSKKSVSKEDLATINQALFELKKDNTLENIVNRYIPKDFSLNP